MASPFGLGYGLSVIGANVANKLAEQQQQEPYLQRQQMLNAKTQADIEDEDRKRRDEEEAANLTAQAINPETGELDQGKLLLSLAKKPKYLVSAYKDFATDRAKQQELAMQQAEAARKAKKEAAGVLSQYAAAANEEIAGGANPDLVHQKAGAAFKANYPDYSDMWPEKYDPSQFKMIENAGMDYLKRREQDIKRDDLERKKADDLIDRKIKMQQLDMQRAMVGLRAREVGLKEREVSGTEEALKPEALEVATKNYLLGFQTQLRGKDAFKVQAAIMNAAPAVAQKYGLSTNIAANRAKVSAAQSTLTQISKNLSAVNAFEATAGKNIKIALDQLKKLPDTGIDALNAPIRFAMRQLGSRDVKGAEAAINVAVNEIAKVTTNPNLTGVLTDRARKEVQELLPLKSNMAAAKRIIEVFSADMANRKEELGRAKKEAADELSKVGLLMPGEGDGAAPTSQRPMPKEAIKPSSQSSSDDTGVF